MTDNEKKIVMPGDQVSSSEELLPGDGTFEDNGVIRAAIMGKYVVDQKNRQAKVTPVTSTPVVIHKGDIVIGEIAVVRSSMVIVDLFHVQGKNRSLSGDTNSTLHASEISFKYVKDPATEYKVQDIIRAKVIQVKPSIQLSTKDKNLGVIKALCVKCRHPLTKKGNSLECPNCGNKERRYIAMDYDNLDVDKI